jgi:RNA polymerase sigma-70 factor (ECF subfamily)
MTADKHTTQSDEDIVAEILLHDKHDMFALLYKRYEHKVNDKCYSLLKDHQLAKEFTADILTRTYERLGSFKKSATFSSWLYSITYNYCIDYLRAKKKLHYPNWNDSNEIPEIIDEHDDETAQITLEELNIALEKIHPEEKSLILMKYQDNIQIKDIAKALRVSESAAKMRLKRAKARVLYIIREINEQSK